MTIAADRTSLSATRQAADQCGAPGINTKPLRSWRNEVLYGGTVEELADGERRVISCDGTEVGVFKVDGELVAWYNQCAHRGGPVCQGRIYSGSMEPVDEGAQTRMLQTTTRRQEHRLPVARVGVRPRPGSTRPAPRSALRKAKLEVADGHVYVVV